MVTLETGLTLAEAGAAVYAVPGLLVEVGLELPLARVAVRQRGTADPALPVVGVTRERQPMVAQRGEPDRLVSWTPQPHLLGIDVHHRTSGIHLQ